MQKFFLFIFILIIAVTTNAQQSVKDTINIEEVVITGTKASTNRDNVALTLSIIKSEQITQSSESSVLPVLSEQVPGLFVTERGVTGFGVAEGAAGQISIRGLGGSPTTRVLVLLNGNPQYMGIMGHSLADAYRSANIERVEIIRGPASTLYGSNAMGGVINIITKEQKNSGSSVYANAMYGSYNTQKYAGGGGYKNNRFNIYGGINYDRTDGHREASYFNITNGYLKTGYVFNNTFNTTADFSIDQFNGADPGMDTSDIIIHGDTIAILRGMGALAFNNKLKKADGSIRLFYNLGNHDITSGFVSNDFNYGLVIYENFQLIKGNTLTLGIDYKKYGGKADLTKFPGGWPLIDTAMQELAGYLTIQQQLFSVAVLQAGLRADNHSVYGTEWVPTAGFSYHPWDNTTFKGSISEGFRSPTIRELFIQFPGAPAPNPNLLPENATNFELSIIQAVPKKALKIELTYFYINAKNLIVVGMNDGLLTFVNTGETVNKGVEFALNHHLKPWFNWNTNYTFNQTEKNIPGTPKHKFFLGTNFNIHKVSANLGLQYINQLATSKTAETYTLLNARVAYQVFQTLQFYIKGDNLLNQQYQINYGYPMPGVTFMAGLNFEFSK